ncbi:MAG TPA: ABC transporter permease [Dehalococcoidia bacterium]|nr:ABC transporter permease [Dehalococcoidia bacterium]
MATQASAEQLSIELPHARTQSRGAVHAAVAFLADPKAAVAVAILAFFLVLAVFAPLIAPYGENQQDRRASLQGPSASHPFGTDRLGRDVLSRIIYGSRVSLRVGFIAVGIAAAIGIPLGLIAGWLGRWADEVIMRVVDAWIVFPNLILLLAIVAILGPGTTNVMIAIGLNSFPIYARLIRAQTLSLKERDFVLAARTLGAKDSRILARHILPNAIQPIIVQGSLAVGAAVLAEAGLSFLGIGVKPPTATWGVIINDGFSVIRSNPWISVTPGIAIVLFVLGVNLLGDRLRDVLDPRLRGSR